MRCLNCDTEIPEGANTCPKCGLGAGSIPDVPNGLFQAVLVTLFCCWPLGIVAIVKANKSEERRCFRDIAAARTLADESRKWSRITCFVGLIIDALVILTGFVIYLIYA